MSTTDTPAPAATETAAPETPAPAVAAPETPAIVAPAVAAPAVERRAPPMTTTKHNMLRQMVADSLVTLSNQLQHYVHNDTAFRERLVRYFHKLKTSEAEKREFEVFQQQCLRNAWSPITGVDTKSVEMLASYPKLAAMAEQFGGIERDVCVVALDYVHSAAPFITMRLLAVVHLWRSDEALKKRANGEPLQDYIDRQVKFSRLIDETVSYSVASLNDYTLETQDLLNKFRDEELKAREDLATEYAQEQLDGDVRRACLVWNIHEAMRIQDTVGPGGLGPMPYFQINCGAGEGDAKCKQYTAKELRDLVQKAADAGLGSELTLHYEQALIYLQQKRTPGEAAITVVRGADGVVSTKCNISTNLFDLAVMGAGAEQERRAIKASQEQTQAEYAARIAKAKAKK